MPVEEVNTEQFDAILASESRFVIIDTWAPWCGPCKSISPYFEVLSDKYSDKMRFLSINIDKEPEIAQRYMITNLPTFIIFKNGEPHNSLPGASRKKLLKFIEETLEED
ncbi:MAG: thioredoxin [Candidatus Heimdallarchaeaceae archaeon]